MPHLIRTMATAALAAGLGADAFAQPPVRVTAQGDRLIVRRCAEPSCDVVAELPRGQTAQVLSTTKGWHRVLITIDGTRATTGWVEAARTAPVATAPATSPRAAQSAQLPERGGPQADGSDPSACLTCVATRTPTADEWRAAMKALPAPGPAATTTVAPAAAPAAPRADVVRRDGRTNAERMRDDIDARHGEELKRLGGLAAQADRDLQTYIGACYEKFLPIQVLPPGPTPPEGNPPPPRPRATIFELWRGRPAWAWTETWSTLSTSTSESTAFCQGLWNDISGRVGVVRTALDRIEAQARTDDIFPGVVRDAFVAYGLSDGR